MTKYSNQPIQCHRELLIHDLVREDLLNIRENILLFKGCYNMLPRRKAESIFHIKGDDSAVSFGTALPPYVCLQLLTLLS